MTTETTGVSERLRGLDDTLALRAMRLRSPVLDTGLVRLTAAASYSRLWLAIAGALAVCGGRAGARAAGRGVAAIAIASALANGPAKLLVRRRRPSRPPLIPMPRSTSFPSGHSASAFAFATGAGGELPALAPALGCLAAAVAYSRVHTGVHYPSDVLAGVAIGVGSGLLARRLPTLSPTRFSSNEGSGLRIPANGYLNELNRAEADTALSEPSVGTRS